jgi:hypothetical protein
VAEPFIEIARAIDPEQLLLVMVRFEAVAPAPTLVDTDVIAAGGLVLLTVEAPGPAKIPNVVFSEPEVLVAELIFLPGELPTILRFLKVQLSALVTTVVAKAIRITEVKVVVLVAVLVMVRSLLIPPVFGLSPSMVTLSAPFSWITPKPPAGLPETVTPSLTGRIETDV